MSRNPGCLTQAALFMLIACLVAPAVPQAQAQSGGDVAALRQLSDAYVAISEKVMPTVVTIYSTGTVTQEVPVNPFFFMFPEFFGERGMTPGRPQTQRQERTIQGMGSGVIVDARRGYLLTNEHVVGDFKEFKVKLYDDRVLDGKVVGTDKDSDLAVLQIEARNLRQAEFGDSDAIRPGEIVLAFGAPFNYTHTVTQGIISAKGRAGVTRGSFGNLIQTSAAINRGNSGGPLVNLDGKVVGINEAIVGPSGGFSGIGLAIPSNRARFVFESLAKHGKVVRGYLGIMMQEVDPAAAAIHGLSDPEGALVMQVNENSPAAKAGVKIRDVIVELNGGKVSSTMDFADRIAQTPPGETVRLKVMRDGSSRTINVKLGERPADLSTAGAAPEPVATDVLEEFGVSQVQALDEATAAQMGLTEKEGVVVVNVARGSRAAAAGLSSGDVIIEVNRKPVTTPAQLNELAAKSLSEHGVIYLSVRNRQGESLVRLEK